MCVLMLRGPQTPGELKQRTERMHAFSDLESVQETLHRLIERRLAARLDRRPGHKEERYAQLLQTDGGRRRASAGPRRRLPASPRHLDGLHERVARLEREVAQLRAAMRHPVCEHQS